jgi:hypothetical protein
VWYANGTARRSASARLSMSRVWGSRLNGRDPVRFETDKKTYQAGEGEPGATARTTRFELFRALSGRRSRDQIRAWEWSADPESYLSLFYVYGPRAEALVEL